MTLSVAPPPLLARLIAAGMDEPLAQKALAEVIQYLQEAFEFDEECIVEDLMKEQRG